MTPHLEPAVSRSPSLADAADQAAGWGIAWVPAHSRSPLSSPRVFYRGFFEGVRPAKSWHLSQAAVFSTRASAEQVLAHLPPSQDGGRWVVHPMQAVPA